MKKLSFSLFVVLSAILASCTLYMDEAEGGRIQHEEEGYTEAETMELPDGQGSVTYKYNQNTIAITDEVEEYVIRVDDDTIVWFSAATPDYCLPQPGEMMTSSFREKFPDGFCHRCIEQKEVDGLFRCVFTPCSIFDAFDEFKTTVEGGEYILPEGATPISAEEMDSIMNDDEDGEEIAGARRWKSASTRASKKVNIEAVTIPFNVNATVSGPLGAVDAKLKITGEFKTGLEFKVELDKNREYMKVTGGPYGSLSLGVEVSSSYGINIKSPIAIPILGFKADLGVVGLNVGLTATPYLNARRTVAGKVTITMKKNVDFVYEQVGRDKEGVFTLNATTGKKSGSPVVKYTFDSDASATEGVELNIEGGVDFQIGFGADFFGTGANIAMGAKLYGTLVQKLDRGNYQSAKDFKNANADFPTYLTMYITGAAKVLGSELPLTAEVGPIKCNTLQIPFFPVVDMGNPPKTPSPTYIYCSRLSPKTYKMEGKLKELGLLGALFSYLPKMRIYDTENKDKLVKTFTMKWKDNDLRKFALEQKCSDLEFNHMYKAQLVFDSGDGYIIPLEDLVLYTPVPEMEITKLDMVQSLTAKNASAEELANPSVIARHPVSGQAGWVKNGKVYAIRYKMNVSMKIGSMVSFYKWGIYMEDKWANNVRFETTDLRYSKPTVRMTWYSNAQEVWLGFTPFGYIIDENGNKCKDSKMYESWSGTAKYSTYYDKQFGYQAWELNGGNAQFEKSRSDTNNVPIPVEQLDFNPSEDYVEIDGIFDGDTQALQ